MMDRTLEALKNDLVQTLTELKEARMALINIRYEAGMAKTYVEEVLGAPLIHNRERTRKIEQHLHTIEEHLGNVLGDVPGGGD